MTRMGQCGHFFARVGNGSGSTGLGARCGGAVLLGRLVEALEAGDEFFGEGFAGLGPEETAGDAAVFLDGEGEGEEHFDVLLDAAGGLGVVAELGVGFVVAAGLGVAVGVEEIVFEGVEHPGGVEAKVDADVAVLLVGGGVEVWCEAEDADCARF